MFVQYVFVTEKPMRYAELRYVYRPRRDRAPRWLHRLWVWL